MAANNVLANLVVRIAAQTAEFKQALTKTQTELKGFQTNITKVAGLVGVAFGVKEVASFAFEVSKLAGEAEGVKAAFDKLPESQKLMERLKGATHDTVSELDLMKRSVQAANFGISLQALPKLLEFASLRAQQTGQSVDYLVDSIVTGIGRKSPLILDNLGISSVELGKKLNGVSVAAASVGDVAEAVGKIASEQLGMMGQFSDNAATKVQKLTAAWDNYKVKLGESANGTGILGIALENLTTILENLSGSQKNYIAEAQGQLAVFIKTGASIDKVVEKLKEYRKEAGAPLQFDATKLIDQFELTGDQADQLNNAIIEINNSLSAQERRIKIFNDFAKRNGYTDLAEAAKEFTRVQYQNILQTQMEQARMEKYTPELKENIEEQKTRRKVYWDLIVAVKDYVASLQQENKAIVEQKGILERLNEQLKELEEQKKKAFSVNEIAALNDKIKDLRAEIDLLNASTQRTSGYFKQLADGVKVEVKEFDMKELPQQELRIPVTVDVDSDRINAGADEIVKQFEKIGYMRDADIKQLILWNEIQNEQFEKNKDMALAWGDTIGDAIGDTISSQRELRDAYEEGAITAEEYQKRSSDSLKRLTASIVQAFLKQALAGIIASATKSGGPPPVVLGLAAAGVAAISAMFSRIGASGGGSSASAAKRVSRSSSGASNNIGSAQDSRPSIVGILKGQDVYLMMKNYELGSKHTKVTNG
jgi:hypothetical protein